MKLFSAKYNLYDLMPGKKLKQQFKKLTYNQNKKYLSLDIYLYKIEIHQVNVMSNNYLI